MFRLNIYNQCYFKKSKNKKRPTSLEWDDLQERINNIVQAPLQKQLNCESCVREKVKQKKIDMKMSTINENHQRKVDRATCKLRDEQHKINMDRVTRQMKKCTASDKVRVQLTL